MALKFSPFCNPHAQIAIDTIPTQTAIAQSASEMEYTVGLDLSREGKNSVGLYDCSIPPSKVILAPVQNQW